MDCGRGSSFMDASGFVGGGLDITSAHTSFVTVESDLFSSLVSTFVDSAFWSLSVAFSFFWKEKETLLELVFH